MMCADKSGLILQPPTPPLCVDWSLLAVLWTGAKHYIYSLLSLTPYSPSQPCDCVLGHCLRHLEPVCLFVWSGVSL